MLEVDNRPNMTSSENNRPFVVSVEGNIGSGKSTMLKYFERLNDVELLPEPVEKWCDLKGHNLLAKLYENTQRWSFQFQNYIQLSRLQLLQSPSEKRVKLLERSIQNNRYCFLELAKREGSLSDPELKVLYQWYDFLHDNMDLKLDLIVYLRTDPEVAYKRMRMRAREEEAGAPLDYLKSLHTVYEDWLIHRTLGPINVPVLVIEANTDFEELKNTYVKHIDTICGRKPLVPSNLTIDK